MILVSIVGTVVGIAVVIATGGDVLDTESATGLAASVLAVSILAQQFGQGVWPLIVVKWKGRSRRDFGLRFEPVDLATGIGAGIGMLILAGLIGAGLTWLVGLDDPDAAENTQFLTDNLDSWWKWVMVFVAVVGAPVSEELFFRGLALRAFQKRLGPAWALVLSTMLFTVLHIQGSSWQGLVVLLGTIGTVGAILGVLALLTGRVAASIVAHAVFNGTAVALTLVGAGAT